MRTLILCLHIVHLNKNYVYLIKWLSLLLIAKKKYNTYYDEPIILMWVIL